MIRRRTTPSIDSFGYSRCTLPRRDMRVRRGQPIGPCQAHALFQRALVLGEANAWEQLYSYCRPLLEQWVARYGSLLGDCAPVACLVSAAFIRFSGVVTPARFAAFPTLVALLEQLQRCATVVVVDSLRARVQRAVLVPPDPAGAASPADEQDDLAAWWARLADQLECPAERVVLHEVFVLGLHPREIHARHPGLFASVGEVYLVKRAVLQRLQR